MFIELALAAALHAPAASPGPYPDCTDTGYGLVWCPAEHGAYAPGRGIWVDTGGTDLMRQDPGYAQQRHEDGTTGTRRRHH